MHPNRMGSFLYGSFHKGSVVTPRANAWHQLSKTSCRRICSQDFYQTQSSNENLPASGQCLSSILHQQDGGTKFPVLPQLTLDLWQWSLAHNLVLETQHIQGVLNVRADQESGLLFNHNDWQLSPIVFNLVNQTRGPLDIDLFAYRLSAQLPRFVSVRPDPEAEALDAFFQDWNKMRGYAFLPISCSGVLSQMSLCSESISSSLESPGLANTTLIQKCMVGDSFRSWPCITNCHCVDLPPFCHSAKKG